MLPPDGARALSVETCNPLEIRAETRPTNAMMRVTQSACVREVDAARAAQENALAHPTSPVLTIFSPHRPRKSAFLKI